MSPEKNTQEKTRLHARNKNRDRYDLSALIKIEPELKKFIKPNKFGEDSVEFSDSKAVKLLNKGLLNHYYGIKNWDFPDGNLCPAIPGRADYLHFAADMLAQSNFGSLPAGKQINVLDIGIGASCIYPIIGVTEYDWNFAGSDIDENSISSAKNIIESNDNLKNKIELRWQENKNSVFSGIINGEDRFDLTICNPPFHATPEEAEKGSRRKVTNLRGKKTKTIELNFAGISNELICDGGESAFIGKMMTESAEFAQNCYWFSTLVSKKSNLKSIYKTLNDLEVTQLKTIPLTTGNKSSRIIAWSFLSKGDQLKWRNSKWK